MRHTVAKPFLALAALTTLLAGCGTTPTALAPVRAAGIHQAKAAIDGDVTAKSVLTYSHAAAHQLDPKAAFVGLTGTRIGADGTPVKNGEWVVQYVGGNVTPATGGNPYAPVTRRILIKVDDKGEATVSVTEEPGMPLGVCYFDSPMPAIDSIDALKAAKRLQPGGLQTPVARMALTGQMTPKHLQRLVWKVGIATQAGDRPIALDAQTGQPVTDAVR